MNSDELDLRILLSVIKGTRDFLQLRCDLALINKSDYIKEIGRLNGVISNMESRLPKHIEKHVS